MSKSNYKTIKISPQLHEKIKNYCNDEGYKLNVWIEKQLEKIMSENAKKND